MTISDLRLENWRKAYALTWKIWEMTPWTVLSRTALIGVEQPQTGDLGFVSVTDEPVFPSISIYRNARGLYGFWYSHDRPLSDYPEQYLEIPQIRIDFKDHDQLDAPDLERLTQLGLNAGSTTQYPVFRSVQSGYQPWFLDDEEVAFLRCVLEQALEVLPRALLTPELLRPQPPDRFPIRAKNVVKDEWRDTYMSIPQPGAEPILFMMDHPLLAKVEKLSHTLIVVEMDFFLVRGIPVPASEYGQRPRYPYLFLTVEASLGMILGYEFLSPAPTLEAMWGLVGWKLVSQFDKLGAIPQTIRVRSPLLVQVLMSFSRTLRFTLTEVQSLPGVDAAKLILGDLNDQHL